MSHRPFPPVPGGYPFPRLELEILEEWRRGEIFRRSLERPAPRGKWLLYEGPPTANNVPHVGHVITRVVKDVFPRFRTMRGHHVPRKAGWDTHGLPVEIEVEKRLGFSGKQQIEAFGIAEFNRECLESVHTYERQWRAMTERVGYWVDLDDPYFTFASDYIESVWWALKRLADQGLLVKGYKIQPYCARCGTTLSSHEVAQNYREVDDPSVWVRFPVREGQELTTIDGERWSTPKGLSLVAWTTTPWTLLAHVGLAVHPERAYRVVADPVGDGELLLFCDDLEVPVPREVAGSVGEQRLDLRELPTVARIRGATLTGLRYDRPYTTGDPDRLPESHGFSPPPSDRDGWCVVPADYVTASEGTGVVHTAPPFGEDDYRSGELWSLPFFLTVDGEGRIRDKPGIEAFAGRWFKEADKEIVRDLRQRGLLLHGETYRHSYPFCWRCDNPLLYYAAASWFVSTTRRREELLAANREIDWHPSHVGEGRFGNWLENVVDWALSRKRYWGTPLPIWECTECDAREVIGSFAELFERAGVEPPADPYDRSQFDPHRPEIDALQWSCAACRHGTMRRVEEVIDAWFDSGAMPFAQHHYLGEPLPHFDPPKGLGFPADLIAEAVDQTRGWFYTLHVLGVLLFDSPAYRHCVVLGHVNDEQGRKMSKRLGNVVDPMGVLAETGADALRWYFCAGNPEQTSRFSAPLVREAAQRFILPLWNALSFFTIYANLDRWSPGAPSIPFSERPALDRWILLRLDQTALEVTSALEGFRLSDGPRALEELVGDLTNWYVRRSRERFWAGAGATAEKESAYQTLHETLATLAHLVAPFTPFLAEALHHHLVRSQDPEAADSVHLEDWPESPGRADQALLDGMAAVQRIVRLGHAARSSHGLKTRQPLPGVTLVSSDHRLPGLVAPHRKLLEEELNVKEIRWADDRAAYVHHQVRPIFPRTGPRFGKEMPKVKRALEAADGDALAAELEANGRITLRLDDRQIELSADEVEVRLSEREGTATQGDRELLVALDTALTPELLAEGMAREVVHRIQSARKQADLEYADRIRVRYRAAPELAAAIETHGAWIAGETLADELAPTETTEGMEEVQVEGQQLSLAIERVEREGAPTSTPEPATID